jgi:hypothetical protein
MAVGTWSSMKDPASIQWRIGNPVAPDPKPQNAVPGKRSTNPCWIHCGSMLALFVRYP